MRTILLRSFLVLLFLAGLAAAPAAASHLVGGEMSYKYLDANGSSSATPYRYRITVLLYINWECGNTADVSNVPDGRCNIFVNIYNKQNGTRINSGQAAQNFNCAQVTCPGRPSQVDAQPQGSYRLPRISNPSITPPLPGAARCPAARPHPCACAATKPLWSYPWPSKATTRCIPTARATAPSTICCSPTTRTRPSSPTWRPPAAQQLADFLGYGSRGYLPG
ncbi:hypothetical protein [Hymenobacter cellulosilyticus]|uniref:Uncharacterized protein n=1 Tax=Hymenobacter cellulosilyticus TaxID=2932248 RepID=A0A8T9Q759_9BACT|nr:hypothetical protein [Hymenobacter cellulosilyticus]UOQ71610.1 hypothetical protein MUN79_23840 [Hymenobacter cellulosilyticus]